MPSNTQVTSNRRRRKLGKIGKDRKRKIAREGSTPRFPIHPEGSATPKSS